MAGLAAARVDDAPPRVPSLEAERQLAVVRRGRRRRRARAAPAPRPGASSASTSHRGGAAEPAPGGDRVGGVAGGRVARLERRRQPALRPEAGALGERGAGDQADGRRPARPRAAPSRDPAAPPPTTATSNSAPWRLSPPSLSPDRLDLPAQPGRRGFAGARLARRRRSPSAAAARRSASSTRFSAASVCASISPRRASAAAIARSLASRSRCSSSSWASRSPSQLLGGASALLLEVGLQRLDLGGGPLLGVARRPPRPPRSRLSAASTWALRSRCRAARRAHRLNLLRRGEDVAVGRDRALGHPRGGERGGAGAALDARVRRSAGGSATARPGGERRRGRRGCPRCRRAR